VAAHVGLAEVLSALHEPAAAVAALQARFESFQLFRIAFF
jgi:hypothetical protein